MVSLQPPRAAPLCRHSPLSERKKNHLRTIISSFPASRGKEKPDGLLARSVAWTPEVECQRTPGGEDERRPKSLSPDQTPSEVSSGSKLLCLLLGVAGRPGSQVFELADRDASSKPRIL
ncbi:unnamed protein product [Rangifer tarandus platyrhynchus]|uniref:Uncharacterized protein n=2 Tax=Rangifer tarandus platyrhynchus TaxID=3082113 RepID=A0ABN8ZB99_RANTA|nr:unnamed protein product [Rangifer tarandus platyrhynchus]CAI9703882.1 unnamed protein product [Rangifer tarandus platyrhynchus]